jgi:eukaryotic-like serine/threonine-protein kinase
MTSDRWQRIEELFLLVADLPPVEQKAKLEAACAGDTTLLADVTRLLQHDHGGAGAANLSAVVEGVARNLPAPEQVNTGNRRLGPYRVVREIGRGGMGVVFEAVRDDDEYQKRVALKVASRVAFSPEFLRRFREERQILARLEHPNIARLLDGGTTEDGIPYFAMEYVEGSAIHEYVISSKLTVPATLRLFLQVCDAVEYAHQNLVIHRDLKPGNILVTNDGSVRLLDFGIAKLMDPSVSVEHTATGLGPLTPDYCSPEQVRRQGVTTRTDVYALGLVLFELLTGERAQRADTTSPIAFDRSICETDVRAPSAVFQAKGDRAKAGILRGDLDTIVLQAAQKDPVRRYGSVAEFAGDIRRFLESRPVVARQDSAWYRAGKFVRRHWLPVGAGALLVVTLVAGIVTTLYQAQRAERRFQQVRRIANALLTDVHGAIRNLPGSTQAQEVVLRTAVEYLDSLSKEAENDDSLQVEIARGYVEVAELSYSTAHGSLDRPQDAKRYLAQARAIVEPLLKRSPGNVDAAVQMINVEAAEATLEENLEGHGDAALAAYERALRAGESARARHPDSIEVLEALGLAQSALIAGFPMSPLARAQIASHIENAERIMKSKPRSEVTISQLGVAYSQAGKIAHDEARTDDARRYFQRNIELHTELVAMEPNNATARRNLLIGLFALADLELGPLGLTSTTGAMRPPRAGVPDAKFREAARPVFERGVEQAKWMLAKDPTGDTAKFDYAVALGRSSVSYPVKDPRALAALDESLELMREFAIKNPQRPLQFVLEFRGSRAERYRQNGWLDRAVSEWKAIEAYAEESLAKSPQVFIPRRYLIPIYQCWADELQRRGDGRGAKEIAARARRQALELGKLESVYARAAVWPPRAVAWEGDLLERLGDREGGAALRSQALELWRALAKRTGIPTDVRQEAIRESEAIATGANRAAQQPPSTPPAAPQ